MVDVDFPSAGDGAVGDKGSGLRRLAHKMSRIASSVERNFLTILRYSALGISGMLLLGAVIFVGLGAARQLGSDQVEPQKVSIASGDVAPRKSEHADEAKGAVTPLRRKTLSSDVRKRTISVYRRVFRNYERSGSKIDEEAVLGLVWPEDRIETFNGLGSAGLINDAGGELRGTDALMIDALGKIEVASKDAQFTKLLTSFRDAKKVRVCNDQTRTRMREVRGWNSYATSCPMWYESPIGCPTLETIEEPYTETVCEMQFPENLDAPAQVFADAVRRYGDTAKARLTNARIAADEETARIKARKLEGQDNFLSSGKLFLGFLALMFLYLFIVMERHHRAITALAERGDRQ